MMVAMIVAMIVAVVVVHGKIGSLKLRELRLRPLPDNGGASVAKRQIRYLAALVMGSDCVFMPCSWSSTPISH